MRIVDCMDGIRRESSLGSLIKGAMEERDILVTELVNEMDATLDEVLRMVSDSSSDIEAVGEILERLGMEVTIRRKEARS